MAAVTFEVSAKDIARVRKRLERYKDKPLQEKLKSSTKLAADLVVPRIRAEGPPNKTGLLRRSVRSKTYKGGLGIGAKAGPYAPHRHLIIRGHRIVTPGGRFTGRSTTPNPYVDRAASGFSKKAAELVKREWFR
jgi:hypothetical protein